VPFMNPIFSTEALTVQELAFCLGLSALVFAVVEVEKLLVRRGLLYVQAAL
jgi:P-type Ca2+ transporter type 2C